MAIVMDIDQPARRRSIKARDWLRKLSLPGVSKSAGERSRSRRLSALSQKINQFHSWPSDCNSMSRQQLLSASFDVLAYPSDELLHIALDLIRQADVLTALNISETTMQKFLLKVQSNMPQNHYHNWHHCVDVAQATVSFGTMSGLFDNMPPLYKFASLVAAFCHDLDHPGLNKRSFGDKHESVVALFGWKSLLERRHAFVAGQILSSSDLDLQHQLGTQAFLEVLDAVSNAILATDMEKHSEFLANLKSNPIRANDYRRQMCLLIKLSDLSNVARSHAVSKKWGWLVSNEILLAPAARPETLSRRARGQLVVSFIEDVALDFFRCGATAYPTLQPLVAAVQRNLSAWRELADSNPALDLQLGAGRDSPVDDDGVEACSDKANKQTSLRAPS